MDAFHELLACPACGGPLATSLSCHQCGAHYAAPDGIPDLRLKHNARTEAVREFYEQAPFPGYGPHETLASLRARAARSEFARLLDQALPADARITEIGCGTGQMSLYLARANRVVIGADASRGALRLGAAAAHRFGLDRVRFIETDLHHAGPASRSVRSAVHVRRLAPHAESTCGICLYRTIGPARRHDRTRSVQRASAYSLALASCRCATVGLSVYSFRSSSA